MTRFSPAPKPSAKGNKHKKELSLRSKLKKELLSELEADGKICPQHCKGCDRIHIPWPGFNLIHKIPLSRGGKTTRENCEIGCQEYHNRIYHGAHYAG